MFGPADLAAELPGYSDEQLLGVAVAVVRSGDTEEMQTLAMGAVEARGLLEVFQARLAFANSYQPS
jgi:hypothetical protein